MSYTLIKELISLVEIYEQQKTAEVSELSDFLIWAQHHSADRISSSEPYWPGKEKGRTADSVINTSLVHLYRYAKQYAKAATRDTLFSTPDDMFYLITLMINGSMTKTALIKHNVHDKPTGIQIINRLIAAGMVIQAADEVDKRNRIIHLSDKGKSAVNSHLKQMREASQKVTQALDHNEKMELIKLLLKLEESHEQEMLK